ncbi:MAG: sigma-70 family RNA polymerase sigma factor [Calditrichaeota bacterium]|nr:sigma-70 family RNA polymerase sigma factor [Calditrichota bacterium]
MEHPLSGLGSNDLLQSVKTKEDIPVSDEELMSRFQAGERAAFNRLVDRYRSRAVSVAFQYVHNLEEAKDVTQDAFVKVFQAADSFRAGEKFSPWFFKILVNQAINVYRRKKVVHFFSLFQNESDDERNSLIDTLEAQDSSENTVNETKEVVWKGIEKLPEKLRHIVVLRDIEGFSEEETSKILNVPLGTVKSRLFHARKKLRKHIERIL